MELTVELKEKFRNELDLCNDIENIILLLKKYSNYELKAELLGRTFEKMFVNKQGFSQAITMDELTKYHHSFQTTNGGDWCRSNSSWLGKRYDIVRKRRSNRIFSIKADGENKNSVINQNIRRDIYKEIKSKRCAILDISTNIECDHKDGIKDDWRLNNKDNQKLTDFQALSKTANDAKRQHCKKCRDTGKRYDAKKLGYSESYLFGSPTTNTCVGCYWYDPLEFNKEISKNYEKKD